MLKRLIALVSFLVFVKQHPVRLPASSSLPVDVQCLPQDAVRKKLGTALGHLSGTKFKVGFPPLGITAREAEFNTPLFQFEHSSPFAVPFLW
jgi:hypothetical protein